MPLLHLRVCDHCNKIRYASCSKACRVPHETDPQSWRLNMQLGAGEFPVFTEPPGGY